MKKDGNRKETAGMDHHRAQDNHYNPSDNHSNRWRRSSIKINIDEAGEILNPRQIKEEMRKLISIEYDEQNNKTSIWGDARIKQLEFEFK